MYNSHLDQSNPSQPQSLYYLKNASKKMSQDRHTKQPSSSSQPRLQKNKSEPSLSLSRSLNASLNLTLQTPHIKNNNGIKLTNSYYNDRQQIYINKSRILSEKALRYRSRDISYSERRKYNQGKIQDIVGNRVKSKSQFVGGMGEKNMSLPMMGGDLNPKTKIKLGTSFTRQSIKNKLTSLNTKKFSQLIHGAKPFDRNLNLLKKQSNKKRQQSSIERKWSSPFRDTNTFKTKFQGKNLISKKIQPIATNTNSTELKVLNLDRLFRTKDGVFGNVVPIPVAKLSQISSRSNVVKVVKGMKKKDTIHEIIEQYNNLLKIARLQNIKNKTKNKNNIIGVRGNNFTRSPTLQQLMGIKLHQYQNIANKNPSHLPLTQNQQELPQQIFFTYNRFYNQHIKKDIHLSRRLIAGLKQQKTKLTLQAYLLFYSIFINKIATLEQNIKFLLYFFIPHNQQKIELGILKLILELMCEQLPMITSLKVQAQYLSKQQKSKIFLQALNRVLFADLNQYLSHDGEVMINRNILGKILERNEEAVGLLVRLLMVQ